MKSLILTLFLFVLSIITLSIPRSNEYLPKGIMVFMIMSAIVALLSGLLLTLWFKGDFESKFKKAIKISYPLTFTSYLIGFSYTLIETLIRQ